MKNYELYEPRHHENIFSLPLLVSLLDPNVLINSSFPNIIHPLTWQTKEKKQK